MSRKGKIIVVEDDLIIQLFLTRILDHHGYEIVGKARRGETVFEILEETKADLILMDIKLDNGEDGIDVATQIKRKHDVPIIFISGNTESGTYDRAQSLQPAAIISKPIDEDNLVDIVDQFFK